MLYTLCFLLGPLNVSMPAHRVQVYTLPFPIVATRQSRLIMLPQIGQEHRYLFYFDTHSFIVLLIGI